MNLEQMLGQAKATLALHQQIRQMFAVEKMQMFHNNLPEPYQVSVKKYDSYTQSDQELIDTLEAMLSKEREV